MCSCVIVEGGGTWDPNYAWEISLTARKAAKLSWRLPRTELRIDPLDYEAPRVPAPLAVNGAPEPACSRRILVSETISPPPLPFDRANESTS